MNYELLCSELLELSRLRKEVREYFFELEDLLKQHNKADNTNWSDLFNKVYKLDDILNNEGK